jgi:hypothetical protein
MARLKRRLALCTLAASLVLALTGIAAAVEYVPIVNGVMNFSAGFSPKQVSKNKPTPITLSASWRAQPGSAPLNPTRELVLEVDRHLSFNVKGLPSCAVSLQVSSQAAAPGGLPERCKEALVGKGSMRGYIFFPEGAALPLDLKVEIFNGGRRDGVTTLHGYAPISFPVPGAVFATIEIRKIDDGRYGSQALVSFPKIAGDSGRITAFTARIGRRFTFKGKPRSVVSLSCPDGKVQIHAEATFADGSIEGEDVVRPCSARN